MSDEAAVRKELQAIISHLAEGSMTFARVQPLEFALGCCEVAYARGVNAGLRQALAQIDARVVSETTHPTTQQGLSADGMR